MFRTKEGPRPMLMGPSLIHTGRTYSSYYKFPESMIKANKNFKNVLAFGIDSEKTLHDSISSVLTSSMHLLCDLHIKGKIKCKLVELGIANENRIVIFDDIFGKIVRNVKEEGLCDCMNVDDFEVCYNDLKTKWINMGPAEEKFVTYFSKHKADHIRNCMSAELRSIVGLGFPPKSYTQNGNECINSIIKQGRDTKKRNLKEMVQLLRSLTRDQEEQVKLSLMGRGEWSLGKKYKSLFQNDLNSFY